MRELQNTCGLCLCQTGGTRKSRNKSHVENELARILVGYLWKKSGLSVFDVLTCVGIICCSECTDGQSLLAQWYHAGRGVVLSSSGPIRD